MMSSHPHDYRQTEQQIRLLQSDVRHLETEVRALRVQMADVKRRLNNLEEITDLPDGGRIELPEE